MFWLLVLKLLRNLIQFSPIYFLSYLFYPFRFRLLHEVVEEDVAIGRLLVQEKVDKNDLKTKKKVENKK